MRLRSAESGVTLLELLLAITLVTLISVGILMAMRVGLVTLDRTNSRLMSNRKVFGTQNILQQELAGFIPVSTGCGEAGAAQQNVRFFQGESESMRLVSSYSLQEAGRGRPQILEFLVIPGEQGNGGVRLVVNEWPYTGPAATGATCLGLAPDPITRAPALRFRPIQPGPNSFVLADRLAHCRFLYRQAPLYNRPEMWLPRWGRVDEWPSAVRVDVAPLAPDPSHPQILPVTVALRADRDPFTSYAEQQ